MGKLSGVNLEKVIVKANDLFTKWNQSITEQFPHGNKTLFYNFINYAKTMRVYEITYKKLQLETESQKLKTAEAYWDAQTKPKPQITPSKTAIAGVKFIPEQKQQHPFSPKEVLNRINAL